MREVKVDSMMIFVLFFLLIVIQYKAQGSLRVEGYYVEFY